MSTAHSTGLARGTTMLFGNGSYFDFSTPDASLLTIEDYAWALCKPRFNSQTWYEGRRCLYYVVQHAVITARKMLDEGCSKEEAFEGLMHEGDEVPWPDFVSPAKVLLDPVTKAHVARAGAAVDLRFGVTHRHHKLVKHFDLRMLATEKRDLMPHDPDKRCRVTERILPFEDKIYPLGPEMATEAFLGLYEMLSPHRYVEPERLTPPFVDDVNPADRSAA